MKSTMLISHLLAHRDGERLDPEIAAHLDADAGARGQLDVLRRIKHELNDLPPVEPDESAWTEIVRARDSHRVWTLRYPVATAAGVFLAAVLAIVAWNPLREIADPGVSRGDPAQVVLATGALQNLVSRSQFLEARMPARGMPAGRFTGNSSQQALLYRIADVDAELIELYEAPQRDGTRYELLWGQRVELLEALADVRRGQAVVRPAVY